MAGPIPLFAVGLFMSFTLSQAGMVRHHLRLRESAWRPKLALNALGATPQDLLAILQAIRSAGALNAEIEVI